MPTKVREAIRMIEDGGWVQVQSKGRHRQFKHLACNGSNSDVPNSAA